MLSLGAQSFPKSCTAPKYEWLFLEAMYVPVYAKITEKEE